MPFNSKTYRVNKLRKDRAAYMAKAREAQRRAQHADTPVSRETYTRIASMHARSARMANMLLRSAIKIKAIADAPLTDFMPDGRYYEEPRT